MKKNKKIISLSIVLFFSLAVGYYFRNFFSESFLFLNNFFSNPDTVGSVIPSSKSLAKEIISKINIAGRPLKILEVGAGTGVMTKEISRKIRPEDLVDVIEVDYNFCDLLYEKFSLKENVHVNCVSILDWNPGYLYDYIISGLPFNAFDAEFVSLILEKYKKLLKPGGIISYFEYIALADIKHFFLSGEKKNKFSKTITTTTSFRNSFEFARGTVFSNVPPARVYHLRID